jgi:hypothetical protein
MTEILTEVGERDLFIAGSSISRESDVRFPFKRDTLELISDEQVPDFISFIAIFIFPCFLCALVGDAATVNGATRKR